MSKVVTSFDCNTLSVPELVQYFSDQGASRIDTFTLGSRTIVMFEMVRSAMQVDAVNELEILEFTELMGYAILYTPYSNGEDYCWRRSPAFRKSALRRAIHLIEEGYEEFDKCIDEVLSVLKQRFKLDKEDGEKLVLRLKEML